ncbi:MAG: hypothetical protein AAFX46_03930 [Cyanobacteria bacterium J06636_27]
MQRRFVIATETLAQRLPEGDSVGKHMSYRTRFANAGLLRLLCPVGHAPLTLSLVMTQLRYFCVSPIFKTI